MPRKRKVKVIDVQAEKENEDESTVSQNSTLSQGPMYTIMSNVQLNETFHKKYIKEMQQLYEKMDHDAFLFTFIKMLKSAMEAEESNEYAHMTLVFCAKYATSYTGEEVHPVLSGLFSWVLSTISQNPHIRLRLCQFVNMLLNSLGHEAALDDNICDEILAYMIQRLRDLSPHVRVQAILALQRLQVPDNPDDHILRAYQYHLSSDPSPKVRQSVITAIGRNYNTIPYILERLWDIDEKVRRHTYLNMSSYPVRAYKVVQRLTLLEQGLYDRSEMVKKVLTTVMLPQWLESYQKDYISFISALKMDADEVELERFKKITKVALLEIFKREKVSDLVSKVPIEPDSDFEFDKCINYDKLTLEMVIFWECLIEYLHPKMSDEIDLIIPELSTFCSYVLKFCEAQNPDLDKFERMEFQYILLSLIEIMQTYDLGDEIGRDNMKTVLSTIIKNYEIDEKNIQNIIKCAQNLFSGPESRMEFFVDIVKDIMDSTSSKKNDFMNSLVIQELLEKHPDPNIKLKLSSLKVRLLDLEEQEMNFVEKKDYVQAQKIAEERNAVSDEYINMLKPLLNENAENSQNSFVSSKKETVEVTTKCLQVSFYMVLSNDVKALTPNVCALYKDFIRRHIESQHISIRDWALKCGTAYSLLYEKFAKDVYIELHSQFYKNHNLRIWKTAIECVFELIDRYGLEEFETDEDKHNRSKKGGRQLFNTLQAIDAEEEASGTVGGNGLDLIYLMSHFLDTCDDLGIIKALICGFCRLVLHGQLENAGIVEKLLLKYFNPATDNEINQLIGVFLQNLIEKRKQAYLQPCLLPTVSTILSSSYESPLHEIKPETVLRFVIDSTRPQFCKSGENLHNTIAVSFMQEMQNNITNKEMCKLLSKEMVTLEVSNDSELKTELKGYCEKILQSELDPKVGKNIKNFQDVLSGRILTQPIRTNGEGSDEENCEDKSDDESDGKSTKTTTESMALDITQVDNTEMPTVPEESETTSIDQAESNLCSTPTTKTPRRNEQTSPQKTPTTYGRENTSNLRYLRKSLNMNQSISNEIPRSPLIRIEVRTDSDAEPTPKKTTPTKEKTPSPKANRTDFNKSDVILASPSAESSRILTRKERLRNKTINTSTQVSQVSQASHVTRNTRNKTSENKEKGNGDTRTVSEVLSRKRPIRLTMSPKVSTFNDRGEEQISPLRKQMKKSLTPAKSPPIANSSPSKSRRKDNIENITPPRVSQPSPRHTADKEKTDESSTKKPDTNKKDKDNRKKNTKSTTNTESSITVRSTRNTTKLEFEKNHIMTRTRKSLDKFSIPVAAAKSCTVRISKIPINVVLKQKSNTDPMLKKTQTSEKEKEKTKEKEKETSKKAVDTNNAPKKVTRSTRLRAPEKTKSRTEGIALRKRKV